MNFLTRANELKDEAISLRRYFHAHPETSQNEYNTANKIEEELDILGLEHKRIDNTGVYAELQGKKGGKSILLRTDTDALSITEMNDIPYKSQNEGVMHACGHDATTAALLTAARMLCENKDGFCGRVGFIFQHAEENGVGAKAFVDARITEGFDRVFGCHAAIDVPAGNVSVMEGCNNASVDIFKIHITGKSAHVMLPDQGADALYCACQTVTALQAITTRRISPVEPMLIGIGILNSGTAYNIISGSSSLEGTLRAISPQTREFAKNEINRVTENVCESYGCSCEIEWIDNTPALINPLPECEEVRKTVIKLFGKEHLQTKRELSMGGDDFARFQEKVKGAYAYVGIANTDMPETLFPLHNCRFNIDEKEIIVAAALHAQYAFDYLNGEFE